MINYSPKEHFQLFHKDEAKELSLQCQQRWLSLSLDHALANMSATGASAEEMRGVRMFIDMLLNLHEKPAEITEFPKKTLVTFDAPPKRTT